LIGCLQLMGCKKKKKVDGGQGGLIGCLRSIVCKKKERRSMLAEEGQLAVSDQSVAIKRKEG